jgi:signal transduction histidine kinase
MEARDPRSAELASPDAPGETATHDLPALDKRRLRFKDPEIERRYTQEQFARALPFIRLSLLGAALLYALFGILDYLIVEQNLPLVWLARYLAVASLLGVAAFTYSHLFVRYSQVALGLATFLSGLGIVSMTALAGPPANHLYYAGLIMVTIYASTMIRMRPQVAAGLSIALVLGYTAVALWVNPIPDWALTSNMFFLTMSTGVGIFSCYALELYLRQKFAQNVALEHAKLAEAALKDHAIQASKAKTEFLANMSHELRTPLNAILGFAEILDGEVLGPLGNDRYKTYAGDIRDSAGHLLAIISDILEISRVDSGKIALNESEVDLMALAEDVHAKCRSMATKRGVRVHLDPCPHAPIVRADDGLLHQCVANLLTNAIKFTASAGEVRITLAHEPGGGCRVQVADTGIGIAPEDRDRIFEPFTQVQSAFARDHGGNGLGLPLVQRIVELHGGEVALTSELSAGTTVTFRLPAERVVGFAGQTGTAAPGIGTA